MKRITGWITPVLLSFSLLAGCEKALGLVYPDYSDNVLVPAFVLSDADEVITVATWNVEDMDLGGELPGGTHASIALAIKELSIEAIGLQETQSDDIQKLQACLVAIGWSLPHSAFWSPQASASYTNPDGVAVLSKWPITESEEATPAAGKTWPRSALRVRIAVGKGLDLYVCHLKSGTAPSDLSKRKAQIGALSQEIRERYSGALTRFPVVIVGDMNTMGCVRDSVESIDEDRADGYPSHSTLTLLESRDSSDPDDDFASMTEALLNPAQAYTWEGFTRSRLDHIALSRGAIARYVEGSLSIAHDVPGINMKTISDHFPVALDLYL